MEMSEKKTPKTIRVGSLVSNDPQELLLKLFHKRNIDRFVALLENENEININHWYGDPENGSLLDLSCLNDNYFNFLAQILKFGANPNIINKVRKKAPIHFLIEREDVKSLEKLLSHPLVDVNIPDSFGNTPLHYAVKLGQVNSNLKDTKCLQLLLNRQDLQINSANRKGQTPAHLAASQGNKDAVLLLIVKNGIDLDSLKDVTGKTARDIIQQKFGEILLPQPEEKQVTVTESYLFDLLRSNNVDKFSEALKANKHLVESHDGMYTLLQYACDRGMASAVNILLELGADVNKAHTLQLTPIMVAARKGFVSIVTALINSENINYEPLNGETVLHSVVNGSTETAALGDDYTTEKNHLKCIDILLNQVYRNNLDLNQSDSKGNTPIHCAGKLANDEMVLMLLSKGAYIGMCNSFNDPAISTINPLVLEKYLDSCIKTNDKLSRESDYEIIINHKNFLPPKCMNAPQDSNNQGSTLSETDLLLYITKSPDFRYLVRHPVITSLIYIKWHNIRKWFFINLLFYLIFWALLSIYILGIYDTKHKPSENEVETNNSKLNPFWFLLVTFLGLLILRELFQLFNSFFHYISNLENWLEVSLISVTIAILFCNTQVGTKQQLAAVGILLSWTELVLLIGKHPALSTNIEMLKTVAWNFSKFLAWYSILIIAFALSFYTLFRDAPDVENNLFLDPGISIFKTVVMLTGEFEAGDIPFVQYPVTSHILFVLFVFAIAIVLYNLLNGLAVNDTQAIKADAEIVGYVSRVKLVSYVETIDPSSCKRFLLFLPWFANRENETIEKQPSPWKASLFAETNDYEIRLYPNQSLGTKEDGFKVPLNCCLFGPDPCNSIIMDSSIVKSAQAIINQQKMETAASKQTNSQLERELIKDFMLNEYRNTLENYKNILMKYSEEIKFLKQEMKD